MNITVSEVKQDWIKIIKFLPKFLLRPVEHMRQLPAFHPLSLLIFQVSMSIASGLLMGLVAQKPFQAILAAFLMVPYGLLTPVIVGMIIYYFFYLFHATQIAPLELFKVLVFANTPFLIFHTLALIFPPIDLVGLALSCLLLIVGMGDDLQLPRKVSVKLVLTLYGLIAVYVLFSWIFRFGI